jgi:integrase/recombinase XerD
MTNETHYFHATDDRLKEYTATIFGNALKSKSITKDDKQLINDFVVSLPKMSQGRRFKYYHYLIIWREYVGPYRKNTVKDIQAGINAFYDSKRYEPSVQREAVYMFRRFYNWLTIEGISSVDMGKLKEKTKLPKVPRKKKPRDQMLTPDEIVAMLKACNNSMEKAFVATLFYGAFRLIEMGTLQWHQVRITDKSVRIIVMEKTDRERDVPIIEAMASLSQWKADYPGDPSGDNYVFINRYHEPFRYMAMTWRLQAIAKRAGITKHVTGHLPRHSRITDLQVKKVSDAAIKTMAWGGESQMLAVYSHYESDDAERELREQQGLTQVVTKDDAPTSHICPKCGFICGPDYDYCPKDGTPLTTEAIKTKQDFDRMADDYILNKMRELEAKIQRLESGKN